jgi:hypothetical protein
LAVEEFFSLSSTAKHIDARVVVCEGEKSAEMAAAIFPDRVTTTSPGGSQAASKADWKPLAGRRVILWPDADEPGDKYANEIASILVGLGCECSIIDGMELASTSPNGGKRPPPKGWDAANAKAEWQDLAALRETVATLTKPFASSPAYISYGEFRMGPEGLTRTRRNQGKNNPIGDWICAPFEIVGACRDPNGKHWGNWLRWKDADRRIHLRHVTDAALQGDPASLCSELASEGLQINRNQQRALAIYLSGANVSGRVTVVSRTGWHEIDGQRVFVLPRETIGHQTDLQHFAGEHRV